MIEPETIGRHRRQLAAMLKAAGDDPESFAVVRSLLDDANAQLPDAARALLDQGFSWADIARPMGLTRQAVHTRYATAKV